MARARRMVVMKMPLQLQLEVELEHSLLLPVPLAALLPRLLQWVASVAQQTRSQPVPQLSQGLLPPPRLHLLLPSAETPRLDLPAIAQVQVQVLRWQLAKVPLLPPPLLLMVA